MTWKDFRPEKSWFPIHLKPGLVKPWRGICLDHLRKAGEKLGEGEPAILIDTMFLIGYTTIEIGVAAINL